MQLFCWKQTRFSLFFVIAKIEGLSETDFHNVMLFADQLSPSVAERFCPQSWQTRGAGFNLRRAWRPSRLEISVVFSKARENTGWDPLESATEGTPSLGLGPTRRQLVLILQPKPDRLHELTITSRENQLFFKKCVIFSAIDCINSPLFHGKMAIFELFS